MADEVQISIVATVENGLLQDEFRTGRNKYDMPTAGAHHKIHRVFTGFGTALGFGSFGSTNKGWLFMQNVGTTDIRVGAAFAGSWFMKLPVGGTSLFHVTAGTDVWVSTVNTDGSLFFKVWRRSE